VNRQALDELKQQIPLLDYLQAQDWQPARHLHHTLIYAAITDGHRDETALQNRDWK
jgi:hypothetical protein